MTARYSEILSYTAMVAREQIALQKGMNFRVRGGAAGYSIILMSLRANAPYQDQWHADGPYAGLLEYEGHDVPRFRRTTVDPKLVDQPLKLPSGKPTDNGKFFDAAVSFKAGKSAVEVVQVYEKVANGIWCDRGRHELVDAEVKTVPAGRGTNQVRRVCRFYLRPTATPAVVTPEDERELSTARRIPTSVKVAVWKRDGGKCVECGSTSNLHFDHDLPWSRGGSSITQDNVKILCAKHNLAKSDKII